jgi:hypothetical protein
MNILGTAVNATKSQVNLVGAPSFAQVNPYGLYNHFKSDEYASSYPNVRPITNELMGIMPYAIDANGKPVPHAALDALYHPNKKDSLPMFMEKVGVSVLALPYTYLLVWRKEGNKAEPGGDYGFKGNNIGGYTFLEKPAITYRDGKIFYTMGAQTFTEDEVIAIPGGAHPNRLYEGYSPAMSACKWATLDGYIGDFQNGFFENNAIPAGVFKVAAPTVTEYNDMVDLLKERHRGAGNNNNVSYTHAPIDSQGKTAPAQIEWIPFAQSNKEIDFEPLLKHVDNRLSEAYGVSSIIKGVDSNAKYSNAEVSEAGFAKRAVKPLAVRIYSQITHELNRITGGLGVAITFKYEIPAVSDAELVKAKTKTEEVKMITDLVALGYSLDSAVDALQLPTNYKLLKLGEGAAVIENDKPEVDEGDEVDSSPDPTKIDGITPLNNAKAKISDEDKLERAAKDLMEAQIDRAVDELKDTQSAVEPTKSELDAFIIAMMATISAILIANGESEYAAGVIAAGLSLDDLQGFTFTTEADDAYRAYLRRVGNSYGNDTAESIRKVLADSSEQGLTRRETEAKLKNILNTDDYRVKRLARTELNNSQNIGKLEGMKSLAAETDTSWEKTIDHSGVAPCPLCQSQEGVWTAINEPLWALDTTISALNENGEQIIYVNNWQTNEGNDYHPNGRGTLVFRSIT